MVDDSPLVRAVLKQRFENAGWAVAEASDGAEAAVVALREAPDLVVTDLEMPLMNGNQLTRLLKGDPFTSGIPVVILTSHREASSRFWSLYIGADAYLVKEDIEDRLLEVASELVASRQRGGSSRGRDLPKGPLEVLARVAAQLDRRLLEATLVTRVMTRGVAEETLDGTYWATLETLAEVVDAHAVAVGVFDEHDASVHCLRTTELPAFDAHVLARNLLERMGERDRQSFHVHVRGGSEAVADDLTEGLPGELTVYDLPSRGSRIGLGIIPRDPELFHLGGHDLIASVTSHLAMVIDNARLAARLRELSTLDGLTRLLNHRSIFSRLEDEISRAKRYHSPLSVVLCDIDHFKLVNDRFGHLVGDAVLRQISKILENTLRTADAVGRYGGEEFLLIMTNTDLDAAVIGAQRLCRAIEEAEFRVSVSQSIAVTASFGVASLADISGVPTPEALVRVADRRLYVSKEAGRNLVTP